MEEESALGRSEATLRSRKGERGACSLIVVLALVVVMVVVRPLPPELGEEKRKHRRRLSQSLSRP